MKVAVARETRPAERRVALTPDAIPKLTKAGVTVCVEPGAGQAAGFEDAAYEQTGAQIGAADGADVLVTVQAPVEELVSRLSPSGAVICLPRDLPVSVLDGRTAFAMELIPRISRAQSMDALSSQALVAGYRAAVVAAEMLPRFFPMSMTAAGTVPPAKVVVLGAGVAGLQAIATARRLGAVVKAYDVRTAAAEEVRSVGADFIELDLPALDGSAGYAREMGEQRAKLQQELLTPHVAEADVLITTAAVPGRPAPRLVTRPMVETMRHGAVVVDLASEQGGNVEGSKPGEVVTIGSASVWGGRNVPSQMPGQASRLYATNITSLLLLMVQEGKLVLDFDDEIISGCCIVHAGELRKGA